MRARLYHEEVFRFGELEVTPCNSYINCKEEQFYLIVICVERVVKEKQKMFKFRI